MNELDALIENLIQTRDFCGNEHQTIRDWEAENRKLTATETREVWQMFELCWQKQQLDAGVVFPIHPDERRRITKVLNRS